MDCNGKLHYKMRALLDEERKKAILTDLSKEALGYAPDFEQPKTFNEKITWMKLYYQDPLMIRCADKYAVKEYVNSILGPGHVVPVLAVWKDPDEIVFEDLPEQFVLKVNWASGYNIIVKDKSALNTAETRRQLKQWMRPERNSYYECFNWAYRHMKPVVYAEAYVEQDGEDLYDYKLFMCGGRLEYVLVITGRNCAEQYTVDFFDREFRHLPFTNGRYHNASVNIEKPKHFDEMVACAEKLAAPFPFVRVDFYDTGDALFVGEMTFYPGDALLNFKPQKWDAILGEKIRLPEKRIADKESAAFAPGRALELFSLKSSASLKRLGRAFAHKASWRDNRYLVLLGLRIPYTTHVEEEGGTARTYLRILGVEFCYRKRPAEEPVNYGLSWTYQENADKEAFLMEEKIDADMRLVHCEQKAYRDLGYFPDLKNPRTLNEKSIWLALHYKNPLIALLSDKAAAKAWIASRVGEEYVVPTIGIYERVSDIDFSLLPQRFVAKLNNGWNSEKVLIVRDKASLDLDKAKAVLSSWLYPWNNYYYHNLCSTDDKLEKPLIVIEEYIGTQERRRIQDFKFFCFDGEPKFAYVARDPDPDSPERTLTFVDLDWNVLPARRSHAPAAETLAPPLNKDEMIRLSRVLAEGFPFVRIDFYEVDGRVYVGEVTFNPSLFGKILPEVWDSILGEYLDLTPYMQ